MTPTDVYRSTSGRVLTIATTLAAVLMVASLAGDVPGADLVLAASIGGLVVLVVWAALGRPAVEVSDGTVVLRNVLRTVTIPWPTVRRTEVGWSLVVHTTGGPWTAWAAPRSGGAARADRRRRNSPAPATRPDGDDVVAGSGGAADGGGGVRHHRATAQAAAASIDARLEHLRRAGHLRDADATVAAHGIAPTVTWHTGTVTCALALVGVAAASRLV